MTVIEKVAYIRGLAEGMSINDSTNEGKLTLAILDVLNDIALTIEDYDETFNDMAEIVSDLEESVYELEDEVFESEDSEHDYHLAEDELYDITCSKCDNVITVDYDVLDNGSVVCPNCNELIEFELEITDKEDCDCGCGNDR